MASVTKAGELDPRKAENWKPAVLVQHVGGKFTKWRKGTRVIALPNGDGTFTIERRKWIEPKLPLVNQMGGVPADALCFEEETKGARA